MKNMFKAKKIPDDYHTVYRAGQVILIRLRTGHNRLNSHVHRKMNLVPSPLCTCGTEDHTTEHRQQNTYCNDVQHTNISDNRYGQTEHHYTRSCMGRKKYLRRQVASFSRLAYPCNQVNEKKKKQDR